LGVNSIYRCKLSLNSIYRCELGVAQHELGEVQESLCVILKERDLALEEATTARTELSKTLATIDILTIERDICDTALLEKARELGLRAGEVEVLTENMREVAKARDLALKEVQKGEKVYLHIHVYIHTYLYIWMYMDVHLYVYMYVYTYICIYIYIYMHIYMHT